jgi:hypothetical protein
MNYLQNKLYCLPIYLIILISFIILNPVNISGQTNNDKLFIDDEQTFDDEKNVENKDALIEKDVKGQNTLIEENVTAQDALIEKDVKGQNTLIEENKTIIKIPNDIS